MAKPNLYGPQSGFDDAFYDMFSTQEQRDAERIGKLKEVFLNELVPFKNHTFKVRDDEEMDKLKESIAERGVCNPIIAFENEDKQLEIVSGHRRYRACELLGMESIPVLVRKMTRDEAIINMAEANLTSRENILPSEKGYSYRAMYEAMKRQAGRPEKNYAPREHNLKGKSTRDALADELGVASMQIDRYIRLTYLIPNLLEYVDIGRMGIKPATELSYLPDNIQEIIASYCDAEDRTPSHAQTIEMKKLYKLNQLDEDKIAEIMCQEKPNQKERYKLSEKTYKKYFNECNNPIEIEQRLIRGMELLKAYENGSDLEKAMQRVEEDFMER